VSGEKRRTLFLLLLAQVSALSLWFVSSAILPDMLREAAVTPFRQAALSSGVQVGFVIGALASAVLGLADRYDPRRVFAGATITAFIAIGAGAPACVLAGYAADRLGKAEVAMVAMAVSGGCALLAALAFGGPVWVMFVVLVAWGISIVPDSALFSALIADAAPPEHAGSLMTLQTALGFALTFLTVQATPVLAASIGWPLVLALMALGPMAGIAAMARLRRLP